LTRRPLALALLLASVCALAPARARAAAWTQDPWHFYLQLGMAFSSADRVYDINGGKQNILVRKDSPGTITNPNPSNFQQLLSDFYWELGVLPRVTFFGDFLFLNSERQQNQGGNIPYTANGLGDLMLGLRFGALVQPFALALETRLWIPTGDQNANIPLGSGDTREELRVVASKSFDRVPIYIDFEFAFTMRGHTVLSNKLSLQADGSATNYSPEVAMHGEIGGTLVRWKYDRVVLSVMADYRASTELYGSDFPMATKPPAFFTIIPETARMTTVGAVLLVYLIRNLGVSVRFSDMVDGARVPALMTFGGAVFGTY
jgi:hypothetical protein